MRHVSYVLMAAYFGLSAGSPSAEASYLSFGPDIWSAWDSIRYNICERTSIQPRWSRDFVVFRATKNSADDSLYGLNQTNAGNLAAQLRLLEDIQSQAKTSYGSPRYHFLTAYLVRINASLISDYFHCEQGECEFRQTCIDGLARTPLAAITSSYARVGIKKRAGSMQISHCRLGRACYQDVCLERDESESRLNFCLESSDPDHDCYFAFTEAGLGTSYDIITKTQSIKIDWQHDMRGLLQRLEDSLMRD